MKLKVRARERTYRAQLLIFTLEVTVKTKICAQDSIFTSKVLILCEKIECLWSFTFFKKLWAVSRQIQIIIKRRLKLWKRIKTFIKAINLSLWKENLQKIIATSMTELDTETIFDWFRWMKEMLLWNLIGFDTRFSSN